MAHDAMRRRLLLAGLGAFAVRPAFSGMLANEVPMQDDGIALAYRFLTAIDLGDHQGAYRLMSERARRSNDFNRFQDSLNGLRRQLGGRGEGRTLVGSSGRDPSVYRQEPNQSARAQWSVRFRSKYPVGALFEDVHLEFNEARRWAVGGWYFSPAPF